MWLSGTNALAYSTAAVITVIKGFTVLVPQNTSRRAPALLAIFTNRSRPDVIKKL
jgi:hypothetical protein